MIGQSAIEALFFAEHGVDQLPVLYLLLGASMVLITVGFGAFLARTDRRRASIAIPIAVAALALAGRAGLAADLGWVTQALWLLQGAGYFVLGLAVWGIAGLVTDTRQAKRFFPLIGAGTVVGTVLGGLVTRPLAAWLGTPNLLFVWVATLVAAVILAVLLLGSSATVDRRGGDRTATGLAEGFRYVRRSSLLRWLSLASILFSLLFFSLYLPFSRAALERYPDPAELAGFFGLFFGISCGVSFLLSLFVTNRLLARFGVPLVAMVLPVLYVVAFGALTIEASFVALAVARFAQVAWMQGGATSAWEAVVNTVPPDRRDQTRAFLYGGPTQVGTILAGLVALVGERAFSPQTLFGIGLGAAVLATGAMGGVRREYPRELVRALREGRPRVFGSPGEGTAVPVVDASAAAVAIGGLGDTDVRVRRVAAAVLGDLDAGSAGEPLRSALRDPDPEVRASALTSLVRLGIAADGEIDELTGDAEPAVRLAAVDAVAATFRDRGKAATALRARLDDDDPSVRANAAAALVRRTDDALGVAALFDLARSEDERARTVALDAIAGLGDARLASAAAGAMRDPTTSVRAAATGALAKTDPDRALAALPAALADPARSARIAAAEALGGIGPTAMPAVLEALEDPERRDGALEALERLPIVDVRDPIRRAAGSVVTSAVARHHLADVIEHRGTAAPDDQREADALRLLADSLRARAEADARDALRAAALLGGGPELRVALDNLATGDGLQRANALEVIENVAERALVHPLLVMWDGAAAPADETDALERARRDPDPWIRACAELAASAASPPGGTMQTLTTLSPMERVLFLRKVPLFTELAPPDLLPIASIGKEATFDDGDTIAEQGEPGDVMHVIVSGDVAVEAYDAGGRRVLATRSSGDVVGEMSLLTSEPRMAGLVARGPVRVLSIDRRAFEAILRERPETSLSVIRVLCQRLTEARDAQADATGSSGSTAAPT